MFIYIFYVEDFVILFKLYVKFDVYMTLIFFIDKFINLMFLAGYVAKQSLFLLSSKKMWFTILVTSFKCKYFSLFIMHSLRAIKFARTNLANFTLNN